MTTLNGVELNLLEEIKKRDERIKILKEKLASQNQIDEESIKGYEKIETSTKSFTKCFVI